MKKLILSKLANFYKKHYHSSFSLPLQLKVWNDKRTLFFSYEDSQIFWIKYPEIVDLNIVPDLVKKMIAIVPIYTGAKGGVKRYSNKDNIIVDEFDHNILDIFENIRLEMKDNYSKISVFEKHNYMPNPQTEIKINLEKHTCMKSSFSHSDDNKFGILFGGGKESVLTYSFMEEIIDNKISIIWFNANIANEMKYMNSIQDFIKSKKNIKLIEIETNLKYSYLYLFATLPLYYSGLVNRITFNSEFIETFYNNPNAGISSYNLVAVPGFLIWNSIFRYIGIDFKFGSLTASITGNGCTRILNARYPNNAKIVDSFHSNWRNMIEIIACGYNKDLFSSKIDWVRLANYIVKEWEPFRSPLGFYLEAFASFEKIKQNRNLCEYFTDTLLSNKIYSKINKYPTSGLDWIWKTMKFAENYLLDELKEYVTPIIESTIEIEPNHPDQSENPYFRLCSDTIWEKRVCEIISESLGRFDQ